MPRRTVLVLVVGLALLTGCSRSVSHAFTSQVPTTEPASGDGPPPTPVRADPITITGAGYDLHTAGRVERATFDGAWEGVLATLNRYLEAAVLTPLRTGGPAGDLAPLFTPLVADRVTGPGPDRLAFIDENLPPASDLRAESSVATLTGLAGTDGTISVVTATLDLRISGHVDGVPLSVARTGDLVLMPDGGTWRIDAWDIRVARSYDGTPTTTTTRV